MRSFLAYLLAYWRNGSRGALIVTILFLATLVTANYTVGIEQRIRALGPWWAGYAGFFLFYSMVLALTWGLQYEWGGQRNFFQPGLIRLLLLAPLYFAAKMVRWDLGALLPVRFPWDQYWTIVLQWPAKLLLLICLLLGLRRFGGLPGDSLRGSVGLTTRNVDFRPYLLLLALLVPVVALAATRPDFLLVYPKLKGTSFIDGYAHPAWPWKLLYELSYGLDFLSIELFFRGLLVIGLIRYAGEQAILPMAAFYCTVHFGKPLGECISSFFGGLVLGVIAYRTRSIVGGLIIHLGLAWMMEVGGWIAQ